MAKRKQPRSSRTDPRLRKPESKRKARLFGARILQRRVELGLSQVQVASLCGWQATQQWKYEAGVSLPRIDGALKLARALQLNPEELSDLRNGNGSEGAK